MENLLLSIYHPKDSQPDWDMHLQPDSSPVTPDRKGHGDASTGPGNPFLAQASDSGLPAAATLAGMADAVRVIPESPIRERGHNSGGSISPPPPPPSPTPMVTDGEARRRSTRQVCGHISDPVAMICFSGTRVMAVHALDRCARCANDADYIRSLTCDCAQRAPRGHSGLQRRVIVYLDRSLTPAI